jgi:hypothetical protein
MTIVVAIRLDGKQQVMGQRGDVGAGDTEHDKVGIPQVGSGNAGFGIATESA